ncbi:MAG: DUF480 domain-containing protein [Solirubrobacterales bacterium]|mgnify:CR=1 FL=1|nr:DUF480 domain-containing protein [Solirubrobacterales bacterium]HMT05888.1 DUF480 domain-containing protein [Solirubrobacterales bacterium]
MIGPDDVEIRVLGCLIEKQRTTPDQYPLTLNSLRLACNQSTNREPVVEYDEAEIRRALGELGRRRWIRGASGHTSRSPKYRHLLDQELSLAEDQVSVLAVLMLRGEQTPGQLKQRTERMFGFHSLDALQTTLDALTSRDLIERLPRRPGQKEDRYRQLLGGRSLEDDDDQETSLEPSGSQTPPAQSPDSSASTDDGRAGSVEVAPAVARTEPLPVPVDTPETERIEALEQQVAELTRELTDLRRLVDDLRDQLGV